MSESVPEPESPRSKRSTSRRLYQVYDPEDDTSAIELNTSTAPVKGSAKQLDSDLPVADTSDASDNTSSGQSSTTQVFVPDITNEAVEVSEISVVIEPLLYKFVNPKHLAKRVIPDSQSFNDSTSTESQKQPSAPVHISSSLPQPTQDEQQAPPSSFIQESDPIAAPAASQLVQVDLPTSSAIPKEDNEEKTTEQPEAVAETREKSVVDHEPQTESSLHQTTAFEQSLEDFQPSISQEQVPSTHTIQSTDSEKQQAHDSGSEESQDIPTQESRNLHQLRRESNDLFHSDRPSSPLPVLKQIITSQDSTQSQERASENIAVSTTTRPEQVAQTPVVQDKPAQIAASVGNSDFTKPFDSQETLSQIPPQEKDVDQQISQIPAPATHTTVPALSPTDQNTRNNAAASVQAPTQKAAPSPTKQTKPIAQTNQPQVQPVNTEALPSQPATQAPIRQSLTNISREHSLSPRKRLLTRYRQSQSPSLSFTPLSQSNLNDMSNVELSSSIPAAPSQMPDTLISQTLPPRPTTPLSYTNSVPRDGPATFQVPSRASSRAPSEAPSQANSARNTPNLSFKERRALANQLAQKAHAEEQARLASQSVPDLGQDVKISTTTLSATSVELQTHHVGPIDLTASTATTTSHDGKELGERNSDPVEHVNQAIVTNTPTTTTSKALATTLPARQALDLYIPIQLPATLSKLYASIFDRQGESIEAFVNDKHTPGAIVKQIEDVVEQANDACFHSDAIGDGPLTQMELDSASQLAWDIQQSPKLAVLDSLLKEARHLEKHIVFVVKTGRIVTLLERFLRASQVNYSCPEDHTIYNAHTSLTVTVLTSDGGSHIVSRADLIIGLDKTFDINSPQVVHLRKQLNDDLCPTVTLLVPFTVEHLTRALRTSLSGDEYLRTLVSGAAHLRKQVGTLQFDPALSNDVGKQLASLLTGSRTVTTGVTAATDIPFPNIDLSPLRDFESPDRKAKAVTLKRTLDDSLAEEQPTTKKTRFEEPMASKDSPLPNSISRVADSTAQPVTQTKIASSSENSTVTKELRLELANALAALANQEAAFSTLEAQFQQKQTELLIAQQELAKVTTALATSETKRTGLVATLDETRQERNTLRKDLDTANKTLAESTLPDIAEYGATRVQAAKVGPLETRLASLQRDFDFTRQQYQNASESASTLSNELDELKAQNEALTAQASGNTIQLRQMFEAQNLRQANDEMDMLRQQLTQRDKRIEHLEKDVEDMIKKEEARGMARVTRSRSPAPKNTLAVPQGHHGTGSSGTASALARSAAAMVRAVSARSPVGSRVGSRASSPLKGVK